ncbi:MerR family transcriptional regulator (plasmid) [Clostridium baratii]
MRSYSIGKVASIIGKTKETLRNWDKSGTFKPFLVTKGGHRFYSQKQLNYLLELKNNKQLNKKYIINNMELRNEKI